jgi:hypothetical protein
MITPKLINYKTVRIEQEWRSGRLDGRVVFIVYALAGYVFNEFGKLLTLTHIYRSDDEQDSFYANDSKYTASPWKSTHQYWRAVDGSINGFTPDELKKINEFLNGHLVYNKYHPVLVMHDVGLGFHFHIQVDGDGVTEIKSRLINSNGE